MVRLAGILVLLESAACRSDIDPRRSALTLVEATASRVRSSASIRSIPQSGPCIEAPPPSVGTIAVARCEKLGAITADALQALAKASESMQQRLEPSAMHAVALTSLVWTSPTRKSLDRSISLLSDLSRSNPSASVHVDLSAAWLDRSEVTQSPMDLVSALDESIRARATGVLRTDAHASRRESGSPRASHLRFAALFNELLAMDRLTLVTHAKAAADSLALVHREEIARTGVEAEISRVRRRSADSPARVVGRDGLTAARELGWRGVLPAWSVSVVDGDIANSRALLDSAERLGERIVRKGGDGSLLAATRSIRALARTREAALRLARAHRLVAIAETAWRSNPAATRASIDSVLRRGLLSRPLDRTLRFQRALTLQGAGTQGEADGELRRILDEPPDSTNAFIQGRAASTLGLFALRAGRQTDGMALLARASTLFRAIHEMESLVYVESLLSEAYFEVGRPLEGYEHAHRALVSLQRGDGDRWRHNVLQTLARAARLDGRPFAALRISEEDVAVTERLPKPQRLEALITRSRARAMLGLEQGARQDLRAARALLAELDERSRSYLAGDLLIAEAMIAPTEGERGARGVELDQVIADSTRRGNSARLLLAYRARAEWRLAGGDTTGAIADLDSVLQQWESRQRGALQLVDRAALVGVSRDVSNRLALLALARGDERGALDALERLRHPLFGGSDRRRSISGRAPATIALALLGDTVYGWSWRGSELRLTRAPTVATSVRQRLAEANIGLAQRVTANALRPALTALYDVLIRPVEHAMPADGAPLRFIMLGELSEAPLPALYDSSATGRYLVERLPIVQGSRSRAGSPYAERGDSGGRVIIVSDPSFDRASYPMLEPLEAASKEARSIASRYSNAQLISNESATTAHVLQEIGNARVLHFAGHGLVDETRPEQSRLVLAGPAANALTAERIANLRLRRLRLVVLSSCTGVSSNRASGRGLADLAGSFLSAGAGGVVASPLSVDDELTRVLMERLHSEYRSSGNGAAALRMAQLQMIRSSETRLNAPGAWAAFRYITQ